MSATDIVETLAHERASDRLLAARGSVFAAFDELDLGFVAEDALNYMAFALSSFPEELRARAAGLAMGFALTAVEADRGPR